MSGFHRGGFGGICRVWSVVWLLLPGVLHAETWHVTYDPAHPEDRVGAIAAQAASGDVILIDPGTYYEHIPLEGKSLTFIGTEGASATTLDGGRPLPDREGSIIYTLTGQSADLALEGLSLKNGTGAHVPGDPHEGQVRGGALLWLEAGSKQTAALSAVDCVFEDNTTGHPDNTWAIGGGAIYAGGLSQVRIERCSFTGNVTATKGSDLRLSSNLSALVTRCDFAVGEGAYDGAVSIDSRGWGELTIQASLFHSEIGGGYTRKSIYAEAQTVHLLDNRFVDHGGPLATRIQLDCLCVGAVSADVLISGNVFWNAAGPDSAAPTTLYAWMPGATVTMRENTMVRCGVEVSDWSGESPPAVFENNIIARGTVFFSLPQGGDYSCNGFWRSPVLGGGNLTCSNNTTANPLFCDETSGDFALSEGSPCAPSSNEECGLIGAEPVECELGIYACCVGQGCQLVTEAECSALGGRWMIEPPYTSCEPNPCVVPVVETTWGGIKAMFRDKD